MSKRREQAQERAAAFVAAVNASAKVAVDYDDVPEPCRVPGTRSNGPCQWNVVPSRDAAWLPELESKLRHRWPPTFRALVGSYLFPSFVCGPLQLYSVGVEDLDAEFELRNAVMRDAPLLAVLLDHGYLPFARPEDGSYDPICFDCGNASPSAEPAVVRVDHEEILCRERIRVKQMLSPAFYLLLERMTKELSAAE